VIDHGYKEVTVSLNAEKERIEEKKRKLPTKKKSQGCTEMDSKKKLK
jgi:hypothetical protein